MFGFERRNTLGEMKDVAIYACFVDILVNDSTFQL
jgi:hypothetical protein